MLPNRLTRLNTWKVKRSPRIHCSTDVRIPARVGRNVLLFIVAALLLGAGTSCLAQTPTHTIWMTATMDGRKVGYLHYRRHVDGNRVVTQSTLDIRLARTHKPLDIRNTVREVETKHGEPLAFSSNTDMSSLTTGTSGERDSADQFHVSTRVGDRRNTYNLAWPHGALLDNGIRLAILAHGFKPGTRYTLSRFNSSSQSVSLLHMEVVGEERVDLPGGTRRLVHLRQTRKGTRATNVTDLWIDQSGYILKTSMPLLGFRLELLACSRACATRPNQDVDILEHAMISVPKPLPLSIREMPLQFVFRSRNLDDRPFVNTGRQTVSKYGRNIWVVNTTPLHNNPESPPQPSDLEANDWLQSDAPAIRKLAEKAVGQTRNDAQRMQKLTQFVHDYVKDEGPSVGYASALETVHTRRGDCTEHAVLLAAMARAIGIPSRVVTGLAYDGRYAGKNRVLIPHTWIQAWVNGAWQEYDAAMPRYDYAHLAMAVGNGDPWKYFNGIHSLGKLQLLGVMPSANIGEDRPQFPSIPEPPSYNPSKGSR
jgi:hypothetical protein